MTLHTAASCAVVVLLLACSEPVNSSDAADHAAAAEPLPPLSNTYFSPDELAQAFLDALSEKDIPKLKSLALNEEEFRLHVWPELPSSRPERGVPFEYGWGDLRQKSLNSLARTAHRHGGKELRFIRLEFEGETTSYQSYKVHRDARVVVFDEEKGKEVRLDLFGSIIEKDGRFKLFSYVVD